MKRISFGRLLRRRNRKLSVNRIGLLAILSFVTLIVLATLYGLAVNDHVDNVLQEHLEWLQQQNRR